MLRPILIISSLLLLMAIPLQAQDQAEGEWKGSINVMNQDLLVEIRLQKDNDQWVGTLNIPQQNAYGLRFSTTKVSEDSVYLAFQAGPSMAIFEGTFSNLRLIEGTYKQGVNAFPFSITKQISEVQDQSPYPEADILIQTDDLKIGGTLIHDPSTNGKPLIILISGSGAQPRDVNVFGFEVFRTLAEELYQAGYPSFRYDDRQTGQSTGDFAQAAIDDLSSDVELIMDHFKDAASASFNSFILLGHSQGGLVAGKTANQREDVSGVILMASPGINMKEVLAYQVRQAYEPTMEQYPDIVTTETINKEIRLREGIMKALKEDRSVEEAITSYTTFYEDLVSRITEASGQPAGNIESAVQRQATGLRAAYDNAQTQSLLWYDPASDLSELNIPVMVIYGEKDTQVPAEYHLSETETALEQAGVNYRTEVIPDANHLFQSAESGEVTEYANLDPTFDKAFIEALVEWLREVVEN